ncbi:MAG: hypothetical protein RIS83_720, partial [Pseudomonadota bacterium]
NTPTNSVNQLAITASTAGAAPSLAATGNDVNIPVIIAAKNIAPVRMNSRGNIALEVNAVAMPVNYVRINGAGGGAPPQVTAQGADANVSLLLLGKGTGAVQAGSPLQLPSYTVAALPAAASYPRCLIYVADGATNKRFAVSDGTNWRWPDGAVVA